MRVITRILGRRSFRLDSIGRDEQPTEKRSTELSQVEGGSENVSEDEGILMVKKSFISVFSFFVLDRTV